MTKENNIQLNAPSVFRLPEIGAENRVSKKYKFITSAEIIEGLSTIGWCMYDASQQNSKKRPETTKHMVKFRHHDFETKGVNGSLLKNTPEIIMINSHDGTTSLMFHIGIYRIYSNDTVIVDDETFGKFNIKHMGSSVDDIKTTIEGIANKIPNVFEKIVDLNNIVLDEKSEIDFAMKAFAIRYPEYYNPVTNTLDLDLINSKINVQELIKPKRSEDQEKTLWVILNKIQEHIIGGGFNHIGKNNVSKLTRPITNIRIELIIKKGLWSLAQKFLK